MMNVSDLREILQYVPRFRGRIFVVALDGDVVATKNFANILLDIAVLRSLSIKVILVHGAASQIEKAAAERGVTLSNSDGSGITDEQTLKLSIEAAIPLTNEIMQGLSAVDLRAAYSNAIIAHPAGILGGVDYLYTGRVERVDTQSLHLFLDQEIVPVIPPFGFDGEGNTFRVNSDAVAVEVADALRASKIIYMSAQGGVTAANGELETQLSIAEAEELLKKRKNLDRNTALKLEFAARACRLGISRVHLLNGNMDEALLRELFSNEGVGTMIYSNEYEHIRRVMKKDVRAIMSLIRESISNEELIYRTRADISNRIEDYWVLEIDRKLAGCVALHPYEGGTTGELACLYVSKSHENQGYGTKLMTFIENLAKQRGMQKLFAISTRAFMYLQQKGGFQETTPDNLPAERREKYDSSGRRARVLVKTLTPKNVSGPDQKPAATA